MGGVVVKGGQERKEGARDEYDVCGRRLGHEGQQDKASRELMGCESEQKQMDCVLVEEHRSRLKALHTRDQHAAADAKRQRNEYVTKMRALRQAQPYNNMSTPSQKKGNKNPPAGDISLPRTLLTGHRGCW